MQRIVTGPTGRAFFALRVLPKILAYTRKEWEAAYLDHPLDVPWSDRDKLAEALRRVNNREISETGHIKRRLAERDGFLRTATAPARSEQVANRQDALRVDRPEQGVKHSRLGTIYVRGPRRDRPSVQMIAPERKADPWMRYYEYREWVARARERDPVAPGPLESFRCGHCGREVWRARVGGQRPKYCRDACRQAAHRAPQDAEPSAGF